MRMRKMKTPFTGIAIIVMSAVFVANGLTSWNLALFRQLGLEEGKIVGLLGISYEAVFGKFQWYRLLTYGYAHTAIWHFLANVFAWWSVGSYLEKKIGTVFLFLIYHAGLVLAGTIIFLFYPDSFNYGASPAIFSCFGLVLHWLICKKAMWREYRMQKGCLYCVLFFVFANSLGWASFVIHFLGFSAGFLLGFFIRESKYASELSQ